MLAVEDGGGRRPDLPAGVSYDMPEYRDDGTVEVRIRGGFQHLPDDLLGEADRIRMRLEKLEAELDRIGREAGLEPEDGRQDP